MSDKAKFDLFFLSETLRTALANIFYFKYQTYRFFIHSNDSSQVFHTGTGHWTLYRYRIHVNMLHLDV